MPAEGTPRQQGNWGQRAPCPHVLLQRDCKPLAPLPEDSSTAPVRGMGSPLSPAEAPGEEREGGGGGGETID